MQAQALEDILQRLENHLEGCMGPDDGGPVGQCAVQVCINCWEEEVCSCAAPRYWPLSHAIGKIRSLLGFEGYTLLP